MFKFFFYCLTVYTSKKNPKVTQNAAYFFPNLSQGPLPKIAGKGPGYTANFVYLFYPFKKRSKSSFPNFDGTNAFPQIQQDPGPDFRKVEKSLWSQPLHILN